MLTEFPRTTGHIDHDGDVRTTDEPVADRSPTAALTQWWVLARRLIRPAWRTGEIFTALLAPAVFTIGFYVPLNLVMTVYGHGLSSYAQFLMPMIIMQAVSFCAIAAAFRSATEPARASTSVSPPCRCRAGSPSPPGSPRLPIAR